jgi:hypothetical protein
VWPAPDTRFTATTFGVAAIGMGFVGVALAAGALLAASLGYRRAHDELTSRRPLSASGVALALMAATLHGVRGLGSAAHRRSDRRNTGASRRQRRPASRAAQADLTWRLAVVVTARAVAPRMVTIGW